MIKPLTSLRFFFALMIFLHHLINFKIYNVLFKEGNIGVGFFFILSGFILSLNYKNKLNTNKINFKEFWVARIARIYPLHLFTLLLAMPLSLGGIITSTTLWFVKFIINVSLLQSFIPIKSYYYSFNKPSWSISDELFFYLLFPFIISIYFKYKKTLNLSIVLVLLFPIGIYIFPKNLITPFFYINPFFRLSDFIIGILLYDLYERKIIDMWLKPKYQATLIEFFSIGLLVLFFYVRDFIPEGYRLSCYYWIPMTLLILVFSFQSGYLSKILSNKILVKLGEISFSFYLIHLLVIKYVVYFNTKYLLINNEYLVITIIFTITLIMSYISYAIIELPCNKYIKSKFSAIKKYQEPCKI